MNAAKAYVDVQNLTVYADASGAPATVQIADYVFACDTLGETRLTCIKPGHGSRTESKIAARRALDAYSAEVIRAAGIDWLARNREVYA